MNIRLEQPNDYCVVENLIREAFWNVCRPGCTVHYVINQYRTNPSFISEHDLVMEDGNKIIGHVMLSKSIGGIARALSRKRKDFACQNN